VPGDNVLAEKLFRRFMDLKQITEGCLQLSVVLAIGPDLPNTAFFHRFLGEKVFGIQLCTSAFISNSKGYPTLPQAHQTVVKNFMKQRCRFIIAPKFGQQEEVTKHYHYICFLFSSHDTLDEEEKQEVTYRNYL